MQLLNLQSRKPVRWTVRRRAYPTLLFRLCVLYLRSPTFRAVVKVSIRHRRFINLRFLAFGTKGYLLATNSRITFSGFGYFVPPQNKNRQYAPSGPDGKTAARFRRRCGWRYCAAFTNISVA